MQKSTKIEVNLFPFFAITALVATILKLTGVVTWSWWVVLAPIWIPIAFFVMSAVAVIVWALLNKDKF